MTLAVIRLHELAPLKPTPGQPCNGCGLCCALEPCPIGALFSLRLDGRCRLLRWHDEERRYRCGAMNAVQSWPAALAGTGQRVVSRWIAAGGGCDCSAQPVADAGRIGADVG